MHAGYRIKPATIHRHFWAACLLLGAAIGVIENLSAVHAAENALCLKLWAWIGFDKNELLNLVNSAWGAIKLIAPATIAAVLVCQVEQSIRRVVLAGAIFGIAQSATGYALFYATQMLPGNPLDAGAFMSALLLLTLSGVICNIVVFLFVRLVFSRFVYKISPDTHGPLCALCGYNRPPVGLCPECGQSGSFAPRVNQRTLGMVRVVSRWSVPILVMLLVGVVWTIAHAERTLGGPTRAFIRRFNGCNALMPWKSSHMVPGGQQPALLPTSLTSLTRPPGTQLDIRYWPGGPEDRGLCVTIFVRNGTMKGVRVRCEFNQRQAQRLIETGLPDTLLPAMIVRAQELIAQPTPAAEGYDGELMDPTPYLIHP